jgi:hypothetical protein
MPVETGIQKGLDDLDSRSLPSTCGGRAGVTKRDEHEERWILRSPDDPIRNSSNHTCDELDKTGL